MAASPWGRGNGFAALGLTEALTSLPAAHPSRAKRARDLSPPHERYEGDAGARRYVASGRGRARCVPGRICDGDDAGGHRARNPPRLDRRQDLSARRRSRVACAVRRTSRRTAPSSISARAPDRKRRCGSISIAPRSAGSTIAAVRWVYLRQSRCMSSIDVTLMRMLDAVLTNSPFTSTVF